MNSKKMFSIHWGDCKYQTDLLTSLADNIHQDMKLKALEFELVRQERDDFRKKYAELLENYDKKEKQICNLELYAKELETRLSYVKPPKEDQDRRVYYLKDSRGPKKRNKSSLLADLLS